VFIQRVKVYQPAGRLQTEAEAINLDRVIHGLMYKHAHSALLVWGGADAASTIAEAIMQEIEL
jgi:hypothetical protein